MNAVPSRLWDPDLPAVEVLLGPDARGPIDAVLASGGHALGGFRMRQVTWWQGRSITVLYEAATDTGDALPQIVACAGSIPQGATVVEADGTRIGLWAMPHDPRLPGLASILDARTLQPMLAGLGVSTGRMAVRLRAYRPGRRAVVQVDTDRTRLFVKLGRPGAIRHLHDTHLAMNRVLPVPRSLGFDPELGILVMPSGRGATLRETIDGSGALPGAEALDSLIARVPAPVGEGETRSPIRRLGSLTEVLARIVPDQAGRLEDLVGRIGDEGDGPSVPAHGDFHDGQLLIEDGAITGLLDVDTHGLGHPADDPATMLGHLRSRQSHAPQPERLAGYADELARRWSSRVDPDELARRTAAVMLGLATGPFRVQQGDWPHRVRERVARAEAALADENPLIAVSGPSHGRPAH